LNYFNYYTEIEETFVRRRGKNLFLSPLDWALMEVWQERGIPLHIVIRSIESVFDVFDKQPPGTRTIKSLFYCRDEIEAQYTEWLAAQAGKGSENGDDNKPVAFSNETVREHISFWTAKVGYAFMFVALPIWLLGFTSWIVGFLIITMVTGLVISIVFQLAHTVEHTEFPMPNEATNKIENEWAIHQVATTANFSTGNKLISWLVGGLNFQIEHHLFPKISHIHYPAISKIIKRTCNDFGIAYREFPKMSQAIGSHVAYLRRLGKAN